MTKRERRARQEVIKIEDIRPGPVRHLTLPPFLMLRIQHLWEVFGEYQPCDLAGWIEGFQRDLHPEREVAIWEGMARALTEFSKGRTLSPEARKEVYLLLLVSTTATDEGIRDQLQKTQHLNPDDLREVIRVHAKAWSEIQQETDFVREV